MGNPAILWPVGGEKPPPNPQRVLWRVYRLRERGEKLPRDAVLRTAQVGVLDFWCLPDRTDLNVWLIHPSGHPNLDAMQDVRLLPNKKSPHGLMVAGTVVSVARGATGAFPQVWWCVVDSLGA